MVKKQKNKLDFKDELDKILPLSPPAKTYHPCSLPESQEYRNQGEEEGKRF